MKRLALFAIIFCCCYAIGISKQIESLDYYDVYREGLRYFDIGQTENAKQEFLKCLSNTELTDRETHYTTQAISHCYFIENRLDSAIYYNEEFFYPPVDYRLLTTADDLFMSASKHIDQDSLSVAIPELLKCIKLRSALLGDTHYLSARAFDLLSYAYNLSNDYEQAINQYEIALSGYDRYSDYVRPAIAHVVISLADLYDYVGLYHKALDLLEIRLQSFYGDELIENRFRISRYLSILGKHKEAIQFEDETIHLADGNISYIIKSYCNKSEYYVAVGDVKAAFAMIDRAIMLSTENALEIEHTNALNIKANLFSITGNQVDAIKCGEQALNIRKRIYGSHRDIAMSYNNLARYYSFLSLFSDALSYQEKCIDEYNRIGFSHLPEMAFALNNYSDYFANQKKYDDAIKYQQQSIDILSANFNKFHPDYAIALNNMARLNSLIGDYDKAIEYEMDVLNIRKVIFNGIHSDIGIAYANLSTFYLLKGDYQKAIEYSHTSLDMYRTLLGENNAEYIRGLESLADIYSAMEDYGKAATTLSSVGEFYKNQYGNHSPLFIEYAKKMAYISEKLEDHVSTLAYIDQVNNSLDDYTLSTFGFLTSDERSQFWERNKYWYYTLLPFLTYSNKSGEAASALYNSLLTSKGILLSTEIEVEEIVKESNDSLLIDKWNHLKVLKSQLAFDYSTQNSERTISAEDAIDEIRNLELSIMEDIKDYGDFSTKFRRDWREIQSFLGTDEIAIEFCTVRLSETEIRYIALVISPDSPTPMLIDLFNESDIKWTSKNLGLLLKEYYAKLWSPILTALDRPVSNIYFSPFGKLYNSPIEYASNSNGECLSDAINIYRLSSTREIIELKNKHPELQSAVVYGGLKYSVSDNDDATIDEDSYVTRAITRNNFEYLPGTLTEANSVCEMLSSSNVSTSLFTGHDGSEQSFYKLNGKGTNIVHLATHGFYYADENDNEWINRIMSQYPPQNFTTEDASLCRTGIILANAKSGLMGGTSVMNNEDGILTAKDISLIDLQGLSLTVLSACQTGQGDIEDDGVFGLQRGLKKAGANALLLSLWDVNDEATLFLMENFYKNVLNGKGFHESLILSQTALREYNNGRYDYPKYWAAFILLDSL